MSSITAAVYGQGGRGKTFALMQAFGADHLIVLSDPTALRAYNGWAERAGDDRFKPVPEENTRFLGVVDKTGKDVQTIPALVKITNRFAAAYVKGATQLRGICYIEASTFFRRADHELMPRIQDARRRSGPIKRFCAELAPKAKALGFNCVFELQQREPDYFLDEDDPTGRYGELKYMGGPLLPYGKSQNEVFSEFDEVWQIETVTDSEGVTESRHMFTRPTDLWFRKTRDDRTPAKVELTPDWTMRDALRALDYGV